jgi:hypothetical protein
MTDTPTTPVPIHAEDPDDDWVTATNGGRSVRVPLMTGGLVLLAVLAGGFWGGVIAGKHHGSGSVASATAASRFGAAARAAAPGGGGGLTFGGGGGANFTTGTVIDVQGSQLDISDSGGNIVKVTVGPSATVTRTAKSSVSGLQIGDTVVITGSAGSGGDISATAVRATAPGATAGGTGAGFSGPGGG